MPYPNDTAFSSPSLRGSGLKFVNSYKAWFKIQRSPSLRGSGLKLDIGLNAWRDVRLPLYEGVDWNSIHKLFLLFAWVSLFTREWIEISSTVITVPTGVSLPLYEGVDWNPFIVKHESKRYKVSLFTREWIEIRIHANNRRCPMSPSLRGSGLKLERSLGCRKSHQSLPLYEGVDWNWNACPVEGIRQVSPSLRGSGLKCSPTIMWPPIWPSPSLRGSGLKYRTGEPNRFGHQSPSLRGSGLK